MIITRKIQITQINFFYNSEFNHLYIVLVQSTYQKYLNGAFRVSFLKYRFDLNKGQGHQF